MKILLDYAVTHSFIGGTYVVVMPALTIARRGSALQNSWKENRTMTTRIGQSVSGRVASTRETRQLPTTDTKGSPREHFNKPLYSQILQARRLLVSEAGPVEKRVAA